jgi:hypothetical protein
LSKIIAQQNVHVVKKSIELCTNRSQSTIQFVQKTHINHEFLINNQEFAMSKRALKTCQAILSQLVKLILYRKKKQLMKNVVRYIVSDNINKSCSKHKTRFFTLMSMIVHVKKYQVNTQRFSRFCFVVDLKKKLLFDREHKMIQNFIEQYALLNIENRKIFDFFERLKDLLEFHRAFAMIEMFLEHINIVKIFIS